MAEKMATLGRESHFMKAQTHFLMEMQAIYHNVVVVMDIMQ